MAHTNTWNTTEPLNTRQAGKGAEELRKVKINIKERLDVDHYMNGELDTTIAGADGHHRKVTLVVQTSDPDAITDAIIIYAKSDGIYFRTSTAIGKMA